MGTVHDGPQLEDVVKTSGYGEDEPLELRFRDPSDNGTAAASNIANKSAVSLLLNTVSRAALDARARPGVASLLQPWISSIRVHIARVGKYSKGAVLYIPLSPPPLFWDYKCKKCGWWQGGTCGAVAGEISPTGWCALWIPPTGYKPFTWPRELIQGKW